MGVKEFPLQNVIPKHHTQQPEFLSKYPECDGRGVTIAVLDTGVDLAAEGMQWTSTGERKIVDCMDLSGAGDVPTTTVRELEVGEGKNTIVGLSGRELKIPDKWINPTRRYHLGLKPLYELYSKSLIERIKKEQKEKKLEAAHSQATAAVGRRIAEHEAKRDDLNDQLEFLREFEKNGEEASPLLDCLVWNDGHQWKACLDTSFCGDLEKCTVLSNYRDEHQWAYITEDDRLSYAITVHDEGKLLEIYRCIDPHGTHVAHIAAGCFPKEPEKNGLAPGAQIVAMTIGDERVAAAETGQALSRAFNRCAELGVDLVNLSYGEGSKFAHSGRIHDWLKRMVEKHGVTFIAAAGNEGPALTTVGSPAAAHRTGGITVGAFLPADCAGLFYGSRVEHTPNVFAFSSRGPTFEGALGIDVCAPGVALTGLPTYELRSSITFNGTSMAAPNCTGNVACMYSALKQHSIPISPFRTRMALENSAVMPQSDQYTKLDIGRGLIQIDRAFELLKSAQSVPETLHAIEVQVADAGGQPVEFSTYGVYLRERYQLEEPTDFLVQLHTVFRQSSENALKTEFERKIKLKCDARWISHTEFLLLTHDSISFQVRVDSTHLAEGKLHCTEVLGYDVENEAIGPLFRVPVTVVLPARTSETGDFRHTFHLKPSVSSRLFVQSPPDASYARLRFTCDNRQTATNVRAQFGDRAPEQSVGDRKPLDKPLMFVPGKEFEFFAHVTAGRTSELVLCLAFSNDQSEERVNAEITYFGSKADPPTWTANQAVLPLDLSNAIRFDYVQPTAKFDRLVHTVRPADSKVVPLGARDLFDGIQVHALLLEYTHKVTEAAEHTFAFPGLSELLYESPIDCLQIQVYHGQKFVLHAHSFPQRYWTQLEKGDYTIRVQIRHELLSFLQKLESLPLEVHRKLAAPIALDCYGKLESAVRREGAQLQKLAMVVGRRARVYFAPIAADKMPKGVKAGDVLLGKYAVQADKRVAESIDYPLVVPVCEPSGPSDGKLPTVELKKKAADAKTPEQEFKESLRDHKIRLLSTIADDRLGDELFDSLVREWPDHLPLLTAELTRQHDRRAKRNVERIAKMADEIVRLADGDEILKHLGAKNEWNAEGLFKQAEIKARKEALIRALAIKFDSLADVHLETTSRQIPAVFRSGLRVQFGAEAKAEKPAESEETNEKLPAADWTPVNVEVSLSELDAASIQLMTFADQDDANTLLLSAKYAVAHGRFGSALRKLEKSVEEKPTREALTAMHELADALDWKHVAEHFRNETLLRFGVARRPF
ncbi:Tripeptidyl-peptidase 2 [Aphelenchoides fujianensis]|nr:Tripeptidyl-peptidase 2 [Aphelenchoides fujianensis]